MTFTPTIPSPVAQWPESTSNAAILLARLLWHYDIASVTWTIASSPVAESGRLADPSAIGVFTLTPLSSISGGTRTLALTRRASDTLILVY